MLAVVAITVNQQLRCISAIAVNQLVQQTLSNCQPVHEIHVWLSNVETLLDIILRLRAEEHMTIAYASSQRKSGEMSMIYTMFLPVQQLLLVMTFIAQLLQRLAIDWSLSAVTNMLLPLRCHLCELHLLLGTGGLCSLWWPVIAALLAGTIPTDHLGCLGLGRHTTQGRVWAA